MIVLCFLQAIVVLELAAIYGKLEEWGTESNEKDC
jgi:hypothetical protein